MPRIDVNGTTLHYRFDGPKQGPPVMLSNSLASNLGMWEPQAKALAGAGFRVLRYDSRGHGRSAAPVGPYTLELLAEDAVGLLDALGLERVHFCGLSKGGMVGQMLAARHPERLITLTLADTAAHMPPPELWNQRVATVRRDGIAAIAEGTLERWFTPAGRARLPAVVQQVREMILSTPVEGYSGCCLAIRDMDLRESLRAIPTPTLVLVGESDPGTPVEAARLIHQRIAGSKLVIIPGAAHLSNLEQAPAFNEALLAFLAAHRGE